MIAALFALALTAPLDAWLGAVTAVDETVVVVPRLDRVLGPLADAKARLSSRPALARMLAGAGPLVLRDTELLPLEPGKAGLDPAGAFFLAGGRAGGFSALPVRDLEKLRAHLAGHGVHLTDAEVAGEAGWRVGDAVAIRRGAHLWLAESEADLRRFGGLAGDADAVLKGCPRGRGEADLFVILRGSTSLPGNLGRGCLTVRVDPDRVRLDALLAADAQGWLEPGAPRLLPRLGADLAAAFELRLGPQARAALRAGYVDRVPASARDLLNALDGAVAAALGPGPTDLALLVGVRDEGLVRASLGALLPAGLERIPEGWRVRVPTPKDWPRHLPRVEEARLGVDGGVLWGTTAAAAPAGDLRAGAEASRGRLDLRLFDDAAALLYLRPSGLPHDGRAWADLLMPHAALFGVELPALQQATGALAFVLAHLGEVGLAVTPTPAGLRVTLEAMLL